MKKGLIGLGLNGMKREKWWKELNQDEKIERTREVLRRLKEEVSSVQKLQWKISKHIHNQEGEAIVEVKLRGGDDMEPGPHYIENKDEVYF